MLVVDLLARKDHVRVGNTVLVGKADVVAAPTDLLCDAGQRVTGLDDITAVTGGLHAELRIDLGLDSIRIIAGSGELVAAVLTVTPGTCDNLGGNGINGLLAEASTSVDLSLNLVITSTEGTLALVTVAPLASLGLVSEDGRLGGADVVDGVLHLSISGAKVRLASVTVSVHAQDRIADQDVQRQGRISFLRCHGYHGLRAGGERCQVTFAVQGVAVSAASDAGHTADGGELPQIAIVAGRRVRVAVVHAIGRDPGPLDPGLRDDRGILAIQMVGDIDTVVACGLGERVARGYDAGDRLTADLDVEHESSTVPGTGSPGARDEPGRLDGTTVAIETIAVVRDT